VGERGEVSILPKIENRAKMNGKPSSDDYLSASWYSGRFADQVVPKDRAKSDV
jgi:hypothetical protein